MKEGVILAVHNLQQPLEELLFVRRAVGPERVSLLRAVLDDEDPSQVDEQRLGISLQVEVDTGGRARDRRLCKDEGLALTNRQRLEGWVIRLPLVLYPLTFPARPKGVRELGDGEDSFTVLLSDLGLSHPSQQAQV